MCYHPEVLWACGCRETANSNLERCGGAMAYGINCIGTMPAPAHRTLHMAIPCVDCRSRLKRAALEQQGRDERNPRTLRRMTTCF
ncbi:uncharacterized protein PG986_002417 [Apiospora aurea]|uniref:Uncharacterized protein n=1 Tax=Apiospora aurea TaxID=335848 RepID=A0ABR1QNS3_9PEZI